MLQKFAKFWKTLKFKPSQNLGRCKAPGCFFCGKQIYDLYSFVRIFNPTRFTLRWNPSALKNSVPWCTLYHIPSGKLTWQWKMDQLKMYSLLKMVIFHCHVSLLEGIFFGGVKGMSKEYKAYEKWREIQIPWTPPKHLGHPPSHPYEIPNPESLESLGLYGKWYSGSSWGSGGAFLPGVPGEITIPFRPTLWWIKQNAW